MFRYSYTIIGERINALPDGETVPKHVGAVLM